jgi:hypothetical protein
MKERLLQPILDLALRELMKDTRIPIHIMVTYDESIDVFYLLVCYYKYRDSVEWDDYDIVNLQKTLLSYFPHEVCVCLRFNEFNYRQAKKLFKNTLEWKKETAFEKKL